MVRHTLCTIQQTKRNDYGMQNENEKDVYYDFYKASKITVEELREFEVYKNCSDEELQKLSDELFDLALVAQKLIIEENV
jgi:hypothetical protein